MRWADLYQSLLSSARMSISIGMLIAGAMVFNYVITSENIPATLSTAMKGLDLSPLGFLLLSLTYLLLNLVFSRLSRAQSQLEERVHDLEILNATARRLSASLQLEELVEAVARETCKAIPEAEAVALVHRRAGGERGTE